MDAKSARVSIEEVEDCLCFRLSPGGGVSPLGATCEVAVGEANEDFAFGGGGLGGPGGDALEGGKVTWERGDEEMPCFREGARAAPRLCCFLGLGRGGACEELGGDVCAASGGESNELMSIVPGATRPRGCIRTSTT